MCIKLNIDLKDFYQIQNVYLKDLKSMFRFENVLFIKEML